MKRDTTGTGEAKFTGRESTRLHERLRSDIRVGRIAVGELLPTVRELSDKHRVSRGTAWRALKALADQGFVAARPRHGYQVVSRDGAKADERPVAYVIAQDMIVGGWDLYYRKLSLALEEAARERGWPIISMIAGPEQRDALFAQISADRFRGVILDASDPGLDERVSRSGPAAVVIDSWARGAGIDSVVQDDFGGGELAAEHLVARGCRQVAWFGPVEDSNHGRVRYGGAAAALTVAGLGMAKCAAVNLDDLHLAEAAMELLSGPQRPDGVLALWRPAAAAIVSAARRLGLKIGSDLQMVGWCAEEVYAEGFASLFEDGPVPAAVVWKARDMARAALARMAARLADPELPIGRMVVPARLKAPGAASGKPGK